MNKKVPKSSTNNLYCECGKIINTLSGLWIIKKMYMRKNGRNQEE